MDIKKLGDYEIIDAIGKGGVGTVYKAKTSSENIVAVKVLNPIALDDKQIINKYSE